MLREGTIGPLHGEVMTLDRDVFQKLDTLLNECIEHLRSVDNIVEAVFPEERRYSSSNNESKVQDPTSSIHGVERGKGPVWDARTRKEIKRCNKFPEASSGNLYMLHVIVPNANDWRPKYIGVSKDLGNRLQEHIAGPGHGTSSQNWQIAHALHQRNKIGFSFVNVVRNMFPDHALCRYVEHRTIEWLHDQTQVDEWELPWNKRVG